MDTKVPSVFVDFFGKPASTPQGAAALALKANATFLVGCLVRIESGRFRMVAEEVDLEPTGDRDDDTRRLTQAATTVMERIIRDYPSQWIWMHKRWKTRPG